MPPSQSVNEVEGIESLLDIGNMSILLESKTKTQTVEQNWQTMVGLGKTGGEQGLIGKDGEGIRD